MSAYVTREEFEARMRILEGEVEGERAVTRHILEQTRRNGDDLNSLKGDLNSLKGDVVLIKAALTSQSALMSVMVQDVREIRAALAPREPPGSPS